MVNGLITILPSFFREKGFDLDLGEPIINGNQYDMLKAVLERDVVLFDASVEWNETSGYDSNYEAATANPISDDRILVVSRTKLPINFVPLRSNIPILGEEEKIEINGKLQSKYCYTNEEIITWVKKELTEMIVEGRIPKKPDFPALNADTIELLLMILKKDFIKTNSDDPEEIKSINDRDFYCTTDEELDEIVKSGKWVCPKSKTTFSVVYRENNNQYRWWPIRMGQRTGPNGVIIEKMPVYEIL